MGHQAHVNMDPLTLLKTKVYNVYLIQEAYNSWGRGNHALKVGMFSLFFIVILEHSHIKPKEETGMPS